MLNPHYAAPEAWEPLKRPYSGMMQLAYRRSQMPGVLGALWWKCALVPSRGQV
ncbi:hypothetical protein ACHQM5_009218 [Ranunculus cassubicifolius]